MASSALVQRIAAQIRQKIQTGELATGDHLSAQKVADQFNVSRSPAREALVLLADQSALEQRPNRGFFVLDALVPVTNIHDEGVPLEEPEAYYRLSEDWLNNAIPAEVTEHMLRTRYDLTKAQVVDVLNRAANVGWVTPKPGYGWRLLDVAKTPESLEQIYKVRSLIEPAALLEQTYQPDASKLLQLKKEQQSLLDGGIETLPADVLLKSGIRFHEAFIQLSGNPLYHMILVQMNNMRRLIEYRSMIDRNRFYKQCAEHIQMIERVEQGDNVEAARLMSQHLSGSLAEKSPILARRASSTDAPGPLDPEHGAVTATEEHPR
ncbi:GntR family transcriptional regulator [Pseudomonas chlororaphis]|uniref:GntR family transcriptional regulator n=1 Tax=Pseudomonas chlororaphis TaxID=587753 RepID=A0A0G3GIG7_9PSED|nr:GntR family transcriptional regulator [Pseudomonas sp. P97.38]AKK00909.1 GntR family transcriptional regulator [Pseudomonas chlororaphis]